MLTHGLRSDHDEQRIDAANALGVPGWRVPGALELLQGIAADEEADWRLRRAAERAAVMMR
jgi:hypothetical protein